MRKSHNSSNELNKLKEDLAAEKIKSAKFERLVENLSRKRVFQIIISKQELSRITFLLKFFFFFQHLLRTAKAFGRSSKNRQN